MEAKNAASGARSRDAIEASIYNHLYTFFSRYYEEGDFISKRRYSRNQRYAIPYNGEEVYLHWANSDQYYVKTDANFKNYDWIAPNDVAVRFRIKTADIEQNNVKGDKRFFLPRVRETHWDADTNAVTIPFEYRLLTAQENITYSGNTKQDKIIAAALNDIPKYLGDAPAAQAALSWEHGLDSKGNVVTHLEHHLSQYTRKNESDFFIHKDLSGFLSRELDFYLKNEVLNLDNLETAGESMSEGWFQQMRTIKSIGGQIIEFLAQIENFQKTLWEKRKFVTETHYCVTLGNIDPSFHSDIALNESQWEEWRDLFDVDRLDRSAFLQANPTLVLDTRHFSTDFIDRLLASFDDLDGMTDGLLVHGENWQVLKLLGEKYRSGVKCIYIDPPYNTDASAIVYKNGYKDSSWLSLMESRLRVSNDLLKDHGILCVAIDDVEYINLQGMLQKLYGKQSHLATVVVRSNPAGRSTPTGFSSSHEYATFFGKGEEAKVGRLKRSSKQIERYKYHDARGRFEWVGFRKHGGLNAYRTARPRLFYPIYVNQKGDIRVPDMTWNESAREWQIDEQPTETEEMVWPVRDNGEEMTWKWEARSLDRNPDDFLAKTNRSGRLNIYLKSRMKEGTLPTTWWDKTVYSASEHGTRALINLFGNARGFSFPKSIHLTEDCLRACGSEEESYILDYFAGSGTTGHAVINLNREDDGQRKFILVEMGDYFDTVLLPRIKKVTYTSDWKDGKPVRPATTEEAERSPSIIKYIRMESYEDALDGIEFDDDLGRMNLEDRMEDYFLKYMLNRETQNSQTLLNVENLSSPFNYRLRAHVNGNDRERNADVAETFNYLLGLNVRTRRAHHDGDRRYLVYRGETRESPGREVAVIWRDTKDWTEDDHERDRQFVAEQSLAEGADTVYVNSPSCIAGAKPLEPIFHDRMFAPVPA